MLNDEILGRWHHLKNNVQHFWGKLSENDFELVQKKISGFKQSLSGKEKDKVRPDQIKIENYHYESHRVDDLQLTLNKDPGPGIRYSYTENSEFARGAEKEEAIGIDKFGDEKDTFDLGEADELENLWNRSHQSHLSDRF